MSRKCLSVLALGAALVLGQPALAEGGDASVSSGTRVDDVAGGFQLITHGVWTEVVTAADSAAGAHNPISVKHAAPFRLKESQATSFRRAVYLPRVYAAEAQYGLPAGLLD